MAKKNTQKSECFEFAIEGNLAMFTQPMSKLSCERISYPFPTFSALCGVLKKLYYRPGIVWVVDKVRIMNEIQYASLGLIMPGYLHSRNKKRQRLVFTYLYNVKYQVQAHYELDYRKEDKGYCNFNHGSAIRRAIRYGSDEMISLGKSGCVAYVYPEAFGTGDGYYDSEQEMLKACMFYQFEEKNAAVRFIDQEMMYGQIEFGNKEGHIRYGYNK